MHKPLLVVGPFQKLGDPGLAKYKKSNDIR